MLLLSEDEILNEVSFFKKVREVIKEYNWKKKVKRRDFDAVAEKRTKYVRKKASSSNFNTFYNEDGFLLIGLAEDEDFCQVIANLLKAEYNAKEPVEIYTFEGKAFNKFYDLEGDNRYQNNLIFAYVPFDVIETRFIVYAKSTLNARYYRDVVDNNEYREYLKGRHKKTENIQWIIDINGE